MFISKGFKILGSAVVPILIFSQTAMASPSTIFYNNAAGQVVSAKYLDAMTHSAMKTKLVSDLGAAELANLPIFVTDSNGTTIDYEKAIGKGEIYATALTDTADAASAPTADHQLNTDGTVTPVNNSGVTVSSVSAVNGTITVNLSAAPTTTPTIADFTVMNGTTAVVPTAITTNGTVVTLTVPTIAATATAQSVVYGVSYQGGTAVNAPAFTVNPVVTQGFGDVNITGQLVGTGTTAAPAVASTAISNNTITLSSILTDSTGNPMAGVQVQVYTDDTSATATVSGVTEPYGTLPTSQTIGDVTYGYSYPVTTDSTGKATITFSNTASDTMHVIFVAPFSNNSSSVVSNADTIGWGQPGSAVLAPVYTTTAHNASLSTSANPTAGLNAFTATVIPQAGAAQSTAANVPVEFTLNAGSGSAMPYFTDSNGITSLAQTSVAGTPVKYTVNTNASGQATIYVNNMQPISNGVAVTNAANTATVGVDKVGSTPFTQTSLLSWGSQGVATQIASMTPVNAKTSFGTVAGNGVASPATNAEIVDSGSQLTLSGVVEDAGGNPVTNATLYIVGNHQTGNTAYALGGSFVNNGTTTNFDSTHAAIVTTDASGTFKLAVTDQADSSVYNVPTIYDVYALQSGAQPVTSFHQRTSSPYSYTGLTPIGTYNVLWQQPSSIQALGVAATALTSQPGQTAETDTLQASYTALSAIPSSASNGSKTVGVGNDQEYWIAPYNAQANTVDPNLTSNSGLTETYTITAPTGYVITDIGGLSFAKSLTKGVVTIGGGSQYVTSVTYTVNVSSTSPYPEVLTITAINGTAVSTNLSSTITGGNRDNTVNASSSAGTQFVGGHVMIKVNTAADGGISGLAAGNTAGGNATFNVTVAAVDSSNHSQGSASTAINATWTAQNAIASLGIDAVSDSDLFSHYFNNTKLPSGLNSSSAMQSTTTPSAFTVAAYSATKNVLPVDQTGVNGPSSITYTITAPNNAKVYSVDGYQLPSPTQTATVKIAATRDVNADNGSNLAYVETLSVNGAQIEQETIAYNGTQYNAYTGVLGSTASGSGTETIIRTNGTILSSLEQSAGVINVGITDGYAETAAVNVTAGTVSATNTITFAATAASVDSISVTPSVASTTSGSAITATFTVLDANGKAMANVPVTLAGNLGSDVWITAVNGTTLTQTTGSAITITTPVPLFTPTATPVAGYSSVVLPGFNATGILNGGGTLWQTPTVTATTNSNGQIVLTLQAGNVIYAQAGGGNAVDNDYTTTTSTPNTITASANSVNGVLYISLK